MLVQGVASKRCLKEQVYNWRALEKAKLVNCMNHQICVATESSNNILVNDLVRARTTHQLSHMRSSQFSCLIASKSFAKLGLGESLVLEWG